MHVNPGKLITIKRKPAFQSKPQFRDTMFFEVDNTTTTSTVATTVTTSTAVTKTTKKKSFISRQFFIHQPSPIPIPSSSSSSSSSSFSLRKRRPLLRKHSSSSTSSSASASSTSANNNSSRCTSRFAELAGGTTAECAAICCCCPCGLVNLLYLTIYKVPAGLCRRAWRRKKRKHLIKKGLLPPKAKRCVCGCDETEIQIHPAAGILESAAAGGVDIKFDEDESEEDDGEEEDDDDDDDAMVKLEKEMWETFYSTGFWRSPSQREKSTVVIKDLSSSNSVAKVKSI